MKYTIVKTAKLNALKAEVEELSKQIVDQRNTLTEAFNKNKTQGQTIAERGKKIIELEAQIEAGISIKKQFPEVLKDQKKQIAEYETLVNRQQARIWELEQNQRDNHGCLLRNKQQK